MAKKRSAKNTHDSASAEATPAGSDAGIDAGQIDPWDELTSLQAGDVVAVIRTWPSGTCAGHLGHIDIDPARVHELPELIKEQFGGGRFLIRWKKRGPDHAGLRFAKGSLPLQIAGEPKLPPGEQQQSSAPASPTPLQLLQMPPSGASQSGTEQHLLNLLTGVIERVGGDASHVDVVGLIQALQQTLPTQQAAPQTDLLGQAERMLLFFGKMQEFMGTMQQQPSSPLGGGGIESMLLSKLMSDPAPQQQAPPMPPPPSPQHVYHPRAGWVLPQQLVRTQVPPEDARKQRAEAETQEARADDDDDDDEDQPLSPEDLVAELSRMSEADQKRFIVAASGAFESQRDTAPQTESAAVNLGATYPIQSEANGRG